jgi:hypothetical protein
MLRMSNVEELKDYTAMRERYCNMLSFLVNHVFVPDSIA